MSASPSVLDPSAGLSPSVPRSAEALHRGAKVTQARVIRSEWTKLTSLRSTVYTLAGAVVLIIGFGAILCAAIAASWDDLDPIDKLTFDPTAFSLSGFYLAQIAVGALGVLMISGEYSTGMIRASLGAVPKRLPVLWAKAAVFGVMTFVLLGVASLVAFLVGQATAFGGGHRHHAVGAWGRSRDLRRGRLHDGDRPAGNGARRVCCAALQPESPYCSRCCSSSRCWPA